MSAKPRIVVVDDKDRDRHYLVRLAKDAGCDVVGTAESGDEGLMLVQEQHPDLVLTDYVMPVPGSKIARETTTPIIIVSTDMEPSWKKSAEEIGPHVTMLDKGDRDGIIAAIKRAT